METSTVVAIASSVIAASALLWAIYTHFRIHKVAKLTYKVSQISDFGVPESFLTDLPKAPLAITVTSRGNKGTENIILRLKTISAIEYCEVLPGTVLSQPNDKEIAVRAERLNPSQTIKFFVKCAGAPHQDQVEEIDLSHSEGAGISEHETSTISINVAGVQLEYNRTDLQTHIKKIGPISFR